MPEPYRTDYLNIHNNRYKILKNQNKTGWDGDETRKVLQDTLGIIERAVQRYGVKIPSRLLELGCGNGCLTIELSRKGFECRGIDIAPSAIEWAGETALKEKQNIDYRVGNVLNLPFPDDFFDIIIDGHCFHCIIDEDRKIFLSEACRVLKDSGIFIIMTMCGEPSKSILERFEYRNGNLIAGGIAGRHIGMPESILEEIRLSGLHIIEWYIIKGPQDMLAVIAKRQRHALLPRKKEQ